MSSDHPSDCVGIDSDQAGKAPGCAGCPNAEICSSTKPQVDESAQLLQIERRLRSINHIILIISGKGGVGKSTFSSILSRFLASNETINVGLLDIDICGPSIPRAMGLEGEQVHMSADGWSPIFVQDNLAVMSSGFLLGSLEDAVIWRGPKKNGLIKQFLSDVDWPPLDYLIIDTPPGTSDEHLSIVSYLKKCSNLRGALIVTTPQEAALLDVRKQIDFTRKVGLPIIGLIENMSHFVCSSCSKESFIFKPTSGGVKSLTESTNIQLLTSIPIDPIIGKSIDLGIACWDENNKSPAVNAYRTLSRKIINMFPV
ncbi:cytosolic Fe-S cluster assembly factor nubp1-like [Panonychus citri]|uniref:cytosolic Fe-S cluster assembly factor nubp1-like n=1 Tax=Panonychus citri TaxID=50023 RepID=UPI002306F45F|nr:cytosolic Fe-S cluster assembly factor nubp1-like [Panonychus citri]XP_053203756.1 cytosolic Fe-S cluster assembly factor nubp1-like [Panonychus citri]XP_053210736.1 cytosolic Fe-S cluster assembly factor nubp1-like [Panonychus citri]